ncbi:hypothetical protein CASFOL_012688 [Castilleja foliolosa]|uniref:Uncharacterized protein n=1 Tax=Castilleja foliolosa TaxID=1961234 RepID=A0ABD3DHY5_9LAMI
MIWYLHVFVHINGAILATLRTNLSCCFRLLICTATGVFGSRDVWEWMAAIFSDGLKEWMATIVRRLQGLRDTLSLDLGWRWMSLVRGSYAWQRLRSRRQWQWLSSSVRAALRVGLRRVVRLIAPVFDEATPKSLMRVMGINGLTLYHLKSHLQKYRLGKSQQSQTYQQNNQEDDGENQTSQIRAHEEINVKLCRHASLAASHFLFTFDLVKSNTIKFMTLSGILTAKRVPDSSNGNASDSFLIELNFPVDPLMEYNGAADVSTVSKS